MSDGDGENLSGNLVRHKDHIPVQLPMIQTQHFVEMWFNFPHRDAVQALFSLHHISLYSLTDAEVGAKFPAADERVLKRQPDGAVCSPTVCLSTVWMLRNK